MDEDLNALKPPATPPEMARWNVEDLEAYKVRLLEEVARVDAVLHDKSSVISAAQNLFKT